MKFSKLIFGEITRFCGDYRRKMRRSFAGRGMVRNGVSYGSWCSSTVEVAASSSSDSATTSRQQPSNRNYSSTSSSDVSVNGTLTGRQRRNIEQKPILRIIDG
ncbi:hypothetical protein L2E82_12590 [Cichorium intybus]|uniref:Uncharacterized protein n=1 Tax=Cichorium intybus TaxID=13427 RepID=A0ACB9GHP5_CICIN|nr:hypothetical protein L2E82_12590 [Cichorium intybus]